MKNIKNNLETLIALIAFTTVTVMYYYDSTIGKDMYLGLLGAIATLYFGSLKYRMENDKMFKELFGEFNNKYNESFNDLLNELRNDKERKLSMSETSLIIDYFNLCAEEFLWKNKNRIPQNVWDAWKAGIIENLKISQIHEVYKLETSTLNKKTSYYGLVDELKL